MANKRSFYGIVAALFVVATLGLFAGTASAQGYTPGGSLTLNKITVPQGGTVTATATGYQPGAGVTFVLNSTPITLGTVSANADGVASITFTIASDFPTGAHTVTSSGIGLSGDELNLVAELTVTAAGTAPTTTGALPKTGSNSADLLRVGALLVAAGGAVVLITRKRAVAKTDA